MGGGGVSMGMGVTESLSTMKKKGKNSFLSLRKLVEEWHNDF